MNLLKCKVTLNKIIYPKTLISGEWGVIGCNVEEIIEGTPSYNKYMTITIRGILPAVRFGVVYTFAGELKSDKYGDIYEPIYFATDYDLKDKNQQIKFLQAFLTQNQIDNLYKTLPDPFKAIQDKNVDLLTKVKGIGVKSALNIIDKFEDNINYSNAYVALYEFGLNIKMIKKLVQEYKSPEIVIEKLTTNPYILADEIEGIGWEKADQIALKNGIGKKDLKRIKAYIKYLFEKESEGGHTFIFPCDLRDMILEKFGEEIFGVFKQALNELYGSNEIYWNENRDYIALRRYYYLEENIAKELIRIKQAQSHIVCDENWNEKIKELEVKQNWEYTDEQINAIEMIIKNNVCVLTGGGGCGKTSSVDAVVKILGNKYSVATCALSGKASARIQEITNLPSYTIHRLLNYDPEINGFTYNKNELLPVDIIIVDEVSMIGGYLFYDLIQAIKSGSKLILIGDDGQLESIGKLNLFYDIMESGVIPTIKLTKIHRQAAKSAIITESIKVRNGKQIIGQNWEGEETRGYLEDFTIKAFQERILCYPTIIETFKEEWKELRDVSKIQVVVAMKERGDINVFDLNNEIQSIVNPDRGQKSVKVFYTKDRKYCLREDDKVMIIKNNYKTVNLDGKTTPIFNGFTGRIVEIDDSGEFIIIDFDLVGKIILRKKDFRDLDLGYVCTVHKKQGDSSHTIIIGLDFNSYFMLTKEWVYTAITRAEKKCILCCETGALRYAISKSNIKTKRTLLQELLKREDSI